MAIQKYVAERLNTTVQKSGFIIHAENGWLGASPDDVHDETGHSDGILEVKCLYSQREVSPKQACIDSTFFCELVEGEVRLKKSHTYYYQVQLQLYVGYDNFKWCDFCIFLQGTPCSTHLS